MQTGMGHMIDSAILDGLSCFCLAKSRYERFSFIVDGMIVLPLSVVGIAGNTLSVIVLNYDTAVNYATTLLLSAIAIVDNVYLVSCLLYQTGKALCYCTDWMPPAFRFTYPQVASRNYCLSQQKIIRHQNNYYLTAKLNFASLFKTCANMSCFVLYFYAPKPTGRVARDMPSISMYVSK